MSLSVEIPFWVTRLELVGETRVLRAPLFPEITWLTHSARALTSAFEDAAMRKWTRRGEILSWLELVRPLTFSTTPVTITLSPPPDTGLPETVTLTFEALVGRGEDEDGPLIGFVPALSLGGRGADEDELRASLMEAIKLEFARKKRLKSVQGILSSQWFASCELIETTATGTFYTFAEVRAANEEAKRSWLKDAATSERPAEQVVFGADALLTELSRAVDSPHASCILLVGPSGVGKSAVRAELSRRKTDHTFWETTAANLERALTTGGGWQESLAAMCTELSESDAWLCVANLAELFEVGRYVGNQTSIAESLRPRISRGELRLITECTPEQVARLEARYPGYLDAFVRITVSEPDDLIGVLTERFAITDGDVPVRDGSMATLLRLLRRFAPYSGFPGLAVRSLEATFRALREQVGEPALDHDTVTTRFCAETGMPRMLIDPTQPLSVDDIRAHFTRWIYGQPDAIEALIETLVSVRAAMTRPRRPIATLLFAGPTGVGKTETAKALAAFMFGSPDRMVRFDMSEYSSPGAALRLSDGPGGEGRLTGAVRRQPFCVLLLDEIEKADPMVFDLLLQVLGEGRLTDGKGRTASFCSCIVIMTSNIGARAASRAPSGFDRGRAHIARLPEIYTEAVQRHFRPEFFNRIDRVVAFSALQPDAISAVLDRELAALSEGAGLRRRRAELAVTEAARAHFVDIGYHPAFGARHLQRALRRHLAAPISTALNALVSENPLQVTVDMTDGALSCAVTERRPDRSALSEREQFEAVADEIDAARRLSRAVLAGALFAELRSRLSILRRKKTNMGQKFWKRANDVARLARLEQLTQECVAMNTQIRDLSLRSDLASLDGGCPPGPLREALTAHIASARKTRRHLYEQLSQDHSVALVGIYGLPHRIKPIAEALIVAAEDLGVGVERANLWLRAEPKAPFPDGTPAYPYLLEPPRDHKKHNVYSQIGVELLVTGKGVLRALQGQAGIISHIEQGEEEERVLILVSPEDRKKHHKSRPINLHRKGSVKGRPRLIIENDRVRSSSRGKDAFAPFSAAELPERLNKAVEDAFHSHIQAKVTR